MITKRYTILEDRDFYPTTKDGHEIWISADIEGKVCQGYDDWDIENFKLKRIKVCLNPKDENFHEIMLAKFDDLLKILSKEEFDKIKERAWDLLLEYGCELIEEDSKLQYENE